MRVVWRIIPQALRLPPRWRARGVWRALESERLGDDLHRRIAIPDLARTHGAGRPLARPLRRDPAQLPAALPETHRARRGSDWLAIWPNRFGKVSRYVKGITARTMPPRWHSLYPPSSGNGQFAVDIERAMARIAGHPAQGRQVPGRPVARNASRIFLHFALISIHAGFVPGAQAQAIRGLHA